METFPGKDHGRGNEQVRETTEGFRLVFVAAIPHNAPDLRRNPMTEPIKHLTTMTDDSIEVIVREGRLEDVGAIMEFNRRLAWETESIRLKPDVLEEGVRAVLFDPMKGGYFVACAGDKVVGQIMHTFEWSDWRNGFLWWIQSVYVEAEYRGRGVFRSLFEHLKEVAMKREGVGLRLYVEYHNHPAQEVYRKLGMEPGGYHVLQLPLVNRFAES